MNSKGIILLSQLQYPNGDLPSYIFESERKIVISYYFDKGIFVWDDFVDVLDKAYIPPKPYYRYKTDKISRPFYPATQEEINYVCSEKGQKEIEIAYVYQSIVKLLKSRKFNDAKLLLITLGKLTKEDYSEWTAEDCPNCILLKAFKIESKDERSFKITESRNN